MLIKKQRLWTIVWVKTLCLKKSRKISSCQRNCPQQVEAQHLLTRFKCELKQSTLMCCILSICTKRAKFGRTDSLNIMLYPRNSYFLQTILGCHCSILSFVNRCLISAPGKRFASQSILCRLNGGGLRDVLWSSGKIKQYHQLQNQLQAKLLQLFRCLAALEKTWELYLRTLKQLQLFRTKEEEKLLFVHKRKMK